uniref:CASP-like protein n=1 Tax=Brassica campestris TaxID=3711 RepID=M4EQ97_BRACM
MASKLVIIIVFILDLIAVGLAIAAEQRRSVGKVVPDKEKVYEYCEYGSDIATSYGAGAFVLLLTTQVIIMVFFLIAEICLLAASIRNAYHTKYRKMWNVDEPPSCEVIRKGVFAAGASFALFTAIVSQFYYVCYSRARDDYKNPPY